ncbi:MAG: hypothetical protein ACPG4K_14960, partial [Haloferula sp.]
TAKKTAKKATKKVAKKAAKKVTKKATKKVVKKSSAKKTAKKIAKPAPTHQQIEEAAYYRYLERCAKGIPGDSASDWATAVSQLTS